MLDVKDLVSINSTKEACETLRYNILEMPI